ncbi:MAG: DUF4445 domain-containing protein [Desulfobacterales bacterium]|nr:DUF4445 domain-containing protein [Desulfobacterales bacterium]
MTIDDQRKTGPSGAVFPSVNPATGQIVAHASDGEVEDADRVGEDAVVIFDPWGKGGPVPRGTRLMDAARHFGVDIEALCGGNGLCGKCVVRVEAGWFENHGIGSDPAHAGPWRADAEDRFISADERAAGYRLACAARVEGDLVIFVPETTRAAKPVFSKAPRNIPMRSHPAVRCYGVTLPPPTPNDPTGDFERLCRSLEEIHGLTGLSVDLCCLSTLSAVLRSNDWQVTASVWKGREIIGVRPYAADRTFGLAVDMGTTTVAAYLCDLTTTEVLATVSMLNPQVPYGEDVMSRISFHLATPDGLECLRRAMVDGINGLVEEAVARTWPPGETSFDLSENLPSDGFARLVREDIEDIVMVGNTAMHHIFLGLDPGPLARSPFVPAMHGSLDLRARDLGLCILPSAHAHLLPNEAGFVGADNTAVLIAEMPYNSDEMVLIVDIGTNGELVLGNRKRLLSASCATGPALEGAHIQCGMRAAPGAIERIAVDAVTLEVDYKVVGRDAWRRFSKPREMGVRGICGSGILDVLAEFFRSGIIAGSGAFDPVRLKNHPRFRRDEDTGQMEFVLAPAAETALGQDIVISQKDIRQIQLAKGAVYAGCKLLMARMGVKRVDRIKIAGAFGAHVDPEKALIMGLVPDCPINAIEGIGNAAGDGCRAALLDVEKRAEADRIARTVEYVELSIEPGFQDEFIDALHLPHAKDRFAHLKGLVDEAIFRR